MSLLDIPDQQFAERFSMFGTGVLVDGVWHCREVLSL